MTKLDKNSIVFIVNVKSAQGTRVLNFLNQKDQKVVCCNTKTNMTDILDTYMKNGVSKFVVCGGDGTINSFVNSYMQMPTIKRSKILLGVLPCGKANDLLRILYTGASIEEVFNRLLTNNKEKKIDLVKVNQHYFITGGGIGLPSDVVKTTLSLSSKYPKLNGLRDLMYYLVVIKKVFFGYCGADNFNLNNKEYKGKHMLIAIMNQEFIGKRFMLSPGAKNDDGLIDVCILPKLNSLSDLKTVIAVTKGKHQHINDAILIKDKRIILNTEKKVSFMADGEIIDFDNHFDISIVPKAVTLFY
jgi:diacylglycerol kinase (ATP)